MFQALYMELDKSSIKKANQRKLVSTFHCFKILNNNNMRNTGRSIYLIYFYYFNSLIKPADQLLEKKKMNTEALGSKRKEEIKVYTCKGA